MKMPPEAGAGAAAVQLLLVEDDSIDRQAVERALAQTALAAALTVVVDAEAALAALGAGSYDCVLLDHNLPRGSGLTVLQALRERDDDTPVIVMTGHGDEELVVELMKAGATDYIAKQSLRPERLAQGIRSALLLRAARRSARASRRALQEQLEFAELLVGVVSHDLRNPLQAIAMSTALIERRGGLPPESVKAVGRINNSAQRAVRLIRDLLDFTQARNGGGIPVHPAPADLVALARSVVDEVALAHPARTVALHGSATLVAEIDADRIAQVLSNLLNNALSYGAAGSPVDVTLRRDADADVALVEVRNAGEPISPERRAVLFEPMRRVRQETARSGHIGLGLFIVQNIVQAHGGSVDLQSGAGQTCFVVRLPLRQPGDRNAAAAAAPG